MRDEPSMPIQNQPTAENGAPPDRKPYVKPRITEMAVEETANAGHQAVDFIIIS